MDTHATGLTLDQLVVLVEVVDAGSFSAAARQHRRTQGAVSYHIGRLEEQLGLRLFDRSSRRPVLTDEGRAIVAHARTLLRELGQLKSRAAQLQDGVEASVSVCFDVLLAPSIIADTLAAFERAFPAVPVELSTGVWTAPVQALREGRVDLAVSPPVVSGDMRAVEFAEVAFVPVVARGHPLTRLDGPVPKALLLSHRRLVLRSTEPFPEEVHDRPGAVWSLDDAATRRGLLLAGAGWARVPEWQVAEDLAAGRLVALEVDGWVGPARIPLAVMVDPGQALGPATRWLFEHLQGLKHHIT